MKLNTNQINQFGGSRFQQRSQPNAQRHATCKGQGRRVDVTPRSARHALQVGAPVVWFALTATSCGCTGTEADSG
jgi:hypothetical protein